MRFNARVMPDDEGPHAALSVHGPFHSEPPWLASCRGATVLDLSGDRPAMGYSSHLPMRPLPAMVLLAVSLPEAHQVTLSEAEARARTVAMLGKFVAWPPRPGEDPARPFVIGVLGVHPFEDHLDRLATGLTIRNHRVVVRYFRRVDAPRILECDLLYISDSEEDRLGGILKLLQGSPILVVGGTPGFATRGVMLNFPIRDGYLRPEVNLRVTREARLEIQPAFLAKAKAQVVE